MKKHLVLITFILVFCMVFSIALIGCNTNPDSEETPNNNEVEQDTTPTPGGGSNPHPNPNPNPFPGGGGGNLPNPFPGGGGGNLPNPNPNPFPGGGGGNFPNPNPNPFPGGGGGNFPNPNPNPFPGGGGGVPGGGTVSQGAFSGVDRTDYYSLYRRFTELVEAKNLTVTGYSPKEPLAEMLMEFDESNVHIATTDVDGNSNNSIVSLRSDCMRKYEYLDNIWIHADEDASGFPQVQMMSLFIVAYLLPEPDMGVTYDSSRGVFIGRIPAANIDLEISISRDGDSLDVVLSQEESDTTAYLGICKFGTTEVKNIPTNSQDAVASDTFLVGAFKGLKKSDYNGIISRLETLLNKKNFKVIESDGGNNTAEIQFTPKAAYQSNDDSEQIMEARGSGTRVYARQLEGEWTYTDSTESYTSTVNSIRDTLLQLFQSITNIQYDAETGVFTGTMYNMPVNIVLDYHGMDISLGQTKSTTPIISCSDFGKIADIEIPTDAVPQPEPQPEGDVYTSGMFKDIAKSDFNGIVKVITNNINNNNYSVTLQRYDDTQGNTQGFAITDTACEMRSQYDDSNSAIIIADNGDCIKIYSQISPGKWAYEISTETYESYMLSMSQESIVMLNEMQKNNVVYDAATNSFSATIVVPNGGGQTIDAKFTVGEDGDSYNIEGMMGANNGAVYHYYAFGTTEVTVPTNAVPLESVQPQPEGEAYNSGIFKGVAKNDLGGIVNVVTKNINNGNYTRTFSAKNNNADNTLMMTTDAYHFSGYYDVDKEINQIIARQSASSSYNYVEVTPGNWVYTIEPQSYGDMIVGIKYGDLNVLNDMKARGAKYDAATNTFTGKAQIDANIVVNVEFKVADDGASYSITLLMDKGQVLVYTYSSFGTTEVNIPTNAVPAEQTQPQA